MDKMQLPALTVQAKAELVSNNFPEFEQAVRKGLDSLGYELLNEDDVAQAKRDMSALKETEDMIRAVDQAIANGSADIKAVREKLAALAGEVRDFRTARNREVKEWDSKIREQIIEDALDLIDHPELGRFRAVVTVAMKGKRKVSTLREAANKKAGEINAAIQKTREVLGQFEGEHGTLLIPDRDDLLLKPAEAVVNELRHRLEKKRDEDEKARLKAEAEAARKEAEAAKAGEDEHGKTALVDTSDTLGEAPAQPMRALSEDEGIPLGNTVRLESVPPPVSAPLPEPPKVGAIPVGGGKPEPAPTPAPTPAPEPEPAPEGETAGQEMARFMQTVPAIFKQFRDARLALKHPANFEAAEKFANAVNDAWHELRRAL